MSFGKKTNLAYNGENLLRGGPRQSHYAPDFNTYIHPSIDPGQLLMPAANPFGAPMFDQYMDPYTCDNLIPMAILRAKNQPVKPPTPQRPSGPTPPRPSPSAPQPVEVSPPGKTGVQALDPNLLLTLKMIDPNFDLNNFLGIPQRPVNGAAARRRSPTNSSLSSSSVSGAESAVPSSMAHYLTRHNYQLKGIRHELRQIRNEKTRDERLEIEQKLSRIEKTIRQKKKDERFERLRAELLCVNLAEIRTQTERQPPLVEQPTRL